MTQRLTCLGMVIAGLLIVVLMEGLPAYREWIVLAIVLSVDVIVAYGLIRYRFTRGLCGALVWGVFSLIYFFLFLSWIQNR